MPSAPTARAWATSLLSVPAAEEKLVSTVGYELMTRSGDASAGILTAAAEEKVDLIVMSTHGRSSVEHMLLGGTTEKLVRSAPCSVLVIRPRKQ